MFNDFKTAVQRQFNAIKGQQLFMVDIDGNTLWDAYLSAFPEGTNPIYKERTEHDCCACRSFIKSAGTLVAISDANTPTSIWDIEVAEPYRTVANALSDLVKAQPIKNVFLRSERTAGIDHNYDPVNDMTWEHFHIQIPASFVCSSKDIGTKLSQSESTHAVFSRGLSEITEDACTTVLELIGQGSLYRGDEHKSNVETFLKHRKAFGKLSGNAQALYAWKQSTILPEYITRIRNTSIGTLLLDLSTRRDLESAVKAFETIVAPTNYKRPTALVTQGMIDKAKETVKELGMLSALDRRYATLDDVSINNLLFVDRNKPSVTEGDAFSALSSTAPTKVINKIEEVTIDKFIEDILPKIDSMEILFENSHIANLVSLIAPSDLTAPSLFKWGNPYSWTYEGEVTDSIKQRVKQAGGNVRGDVRVSLSWFNYDDLDLHIIEPSKREIYYGDKISRYTGGNLDVDMNAGHLTRTPVENVAYPSKARMADGEYLVYVHQFKCRETTNPGFELEIEFGGEIYPFAYSKKVSGKVQIAAIVYDKKTGTLTLKPILPTSSIMKEAWGLQTKTFHKVQAVSLSPNYWDGQQIGNKHYMFFIEGACKEGSARGFFNEFLSDNLSQHRKVLELLGSKVVAPESDRQLSGLGFASTVRNSLTAKVTGSFTRTIKIVF